MTLLGSSSTISAAESLSLNGAWQARIDEADKGLGQRWFAQPLKSADEVTLPGSLAQSGLGRVQSQAVRTPMGHQRQG